MRPEDRDPAILFDIHLECQHIISSTNGLSRSEFERDRLTADALHHSLVQLGYYCSRLSDTFKSLHTDIEWSRIIEQCDKLISVYWNIDNDTVWSLIQKDVPVLGKISSHIETSAEPG